METTTETPKKKHTRNTPDVRAQQPTNQHACRLCRTKREARYFVCINKQTKSKVENKLYAWKIKTIIGIDVSWDENKDAKMCHTCQHKIDGIWKYR